MRTKFAINKIIVSKGIKSSNRKPIDFFVLYLSNHKSLERCLVWRFDFFDKNNQTDVIQNIVLSLRIKSKNNLNMLFQFVLVEEPFSALRKIRTNQATFLEQIFELTIGCRFINNELMPNNFKINFKFTNKGLLDQAKDNRNH